MHCTSLLQRSKYCPEADAPNPISGVELHCKVSPSTYQLRQVQMCLELSVIRGTFIVPCARGGMADAPDLGSGPVRGGGSSPLARTILKQVIFQRCDS